MQETTSAKEGPVPEDKLKELLDQLTEEVQKELDKASPDENASGVSKDKDLISDDLLTTRSMSLPGAIGRIIPGLSVKLGGKLAGLRIGYYASLEDSDDLGELHAIEWGDKLPPDEKLATDEREVEGTDEPDPEKNPLSFRFLDDLAESLKEQLYEALEKKGYKLHVYIAGGVTHSPHRYFRVACCPSGRRLIRRLDGTYRCVGWC